MGQENLPSLKEPMDTIFVKSVKEGGAAFVAGLRIGTSTENRVFLSLEFFFILLFFLCVLLRRSDRVCEWNFCDGEILRSSCAADQSHSS